MSEDFEVRRDALTKAHGHPCHYPGADACRLPGGAAAGLNISEVLAFAYPSREAARAFHQLAHDEHGHASLGIVPDPSGSGGSSGCWTSAPGWPRRGSGTARTAARREVSTPCRALAGTRPADAPGAVAAGHRGRRRHRCSREPHPLGLVAAGRGMALPVGCRVPARSGPRLGGEAALGWVAKRIGVKS